MLKKRLACRRLYVPYLAPGEVELRARRSAQSGNGDEEHVAGTNARISVDGCVDVRAGRRCIDPAAAGYALARVPCSHGAARSRGHATVGLRNHDTATTWRHRHTARLGTAVQSCDGS